MYPVPHLPLMGEEGIAKDARRIAAWGPIKLKIGGIVYMFYVPGVLYKLLTTYLQCNADVLLPYFIGLYSDALTTGVSLLRPVIECLLPRRL